MSRTEIQSFCATKTNFQTEGLTDGEWTNHLLLEELIGSMLNAKVRVFSDSLQVSRWTLDGTCVLLTCSEFSGQDHIFASNVHRTSPTGNVRKYEQHVFLKRKT